MASPFVPFDAEFTNRTSPLKNPVAELNPKVVASILGDVGATANDCLTLLYEKCEAASVNPMLDI